MARGVALAMKLEYQKCRTFHHQWDEFIPRAGDRKPAPYGRGFSLRCERCAAERHDTFDAYGNLSARSYVYPSGYEVAADEKPTIEQLRLSIVKELKTEAADRAARAPSHRKHHAAPTRRKHLEAVS